VWRGPLYRIMLDFEQIEFAKRGEIGGEGPDLVPAQVENPNVDEGAWRGRE
jgi:hypothetical protein